MLLGLDFRKDGGSIVIGGKDPYEFESIKSLFPEYGMFSYASIVSGPEGHSVSAHNVEYDVAMEELFETFRNEYNVGDPLDVYPVTVTIDGKTSMYLLFDFPAAENCHFIMSIIFDD